MDLFSGAGIVAAKMPVDVILQQMSDGMVKTVGIFFLTLLFSLPLGMIIAFGRMSKNIILSSIVKLYISVMRGTPLMLQLMVIYFGPNILFGLKIAEFRFSAVIIAFSLNYAAYFAKSIVPESKLCQSDNTKQPICLDTTRYRHFQNHLSSGN